MPGPRQSSEAPPGRTPRPGPLCLLCPRPRPWEPSRDPSLVLRQLPPFSPDLPDPRAPGPSAPLPQPGPQPRPLADPTQAPHPAHTSLRARVPPCPPRFLPPRPPRVAPPLPPPVSPRASPPRVPRPPRARRRNCGIAAHRKWRRRRGRGRRAAGWGPGAAGAALAEAPTQGRAGPRAEERSGRSGAAEATPGTPARRAGGGGCRLVQPEALRTAVPTGSADLVPWTAVLSEGPCTRS